MPHFVSPHFTEEELCCRCGCRRYATDYRFIRRLEEARVKSGTPYIVRSGCRCPDHNKEVGGEENSAHLTNPDQGELCQAVDIETMTSRERFKILTGLLAAGFTRIGFGRDFIHVDCDMSKPQEVIFME